ncbi:hypothetical protein [Ruegeria meonggei]|uniref:hypothetical protein n=1 Tax=Ruegeria meonggei TaxID=1446476 RepID=UPI00366E15C3
MLPTVVDPVGFVRRLDRAVIDGIQWKPDLLFAIKKTLMTELLVLPICRASQLIPKLFTGWSKLKSGIADAQAVVLEKAKLCSPAERPSSITCRF